MSVKSCSAPPIVGLWMLSFTCWHSRSEFKCHCAHYFNSNLVFQPLAVPRLKNLCVKSSIGQLRLWTSGLLFSEEKMADYSLSSCMQHTQEWNSFQARRRQRGIVQLWWKCYAATSLNIWPCAATPLFYPILLKCKCSQTHWHIKQSFSKSQYPDEASADWWAKREIHSAQKIQHSSLMFAPTTKKTLISAVQRFFDWKWKYWCLSGERRPYKSFSARPIVGLSECSLWAPTTDLTYKCHSIFSG